MLSSSRKLSNFCTVNIQSLRSKIALLENLCDENGIDVLCIQEHWMVHEEITLYNTISNLNLVAYFCRSRPWGGVALYVNNKLNCKPLDLEKFSVEMHGEFAGVVINELSTVVVTMYRSPSGNGVTFFNLLELCLEYLLTLGLFVIIGTDHNINLLRHSSEVTDFLNLLRSYNLYCTIIEPTREKASLDTFISNFDRWNYKAAVSREQIADHQHVFLSIETESSGTIAENRLLDTNSSPEVSFRVFNPSNVKYFNDMVSTHIDLWCETLPYLTANEAFHCLFDNIKHAFDLCIPLKRKTSQAGVVNSNRKTHSSDWFGPELSRLRNLVIFVSDLSKNNPTLIPYLKNLRTNYKTKVKEAKQASVAASISNAANPCKAAWDFIKATKSKPTVSGKTFAQAEEFNQYFVNSVEELIGGCSTSLTPSTSTDNVENSLKSVPIVPFNFSWRPVTPTAIINIVHSFKLSKSKDCFDMTIELLKETPS